jgi:hypothetical protein
MRRQLQKFYGRKWAEIDHLESADRHFQTMLVAFTAYYQPFRFFSKNVVKAYTAV